MKFIGLIVSIFPCSTEAPLHYRTLERKKIKISKEMVNHSWVKQGMHQRASLVAWVFGNPSI